MAPQRPPTPLRILPAPVLIPVMRTAKGAIINFIISKYYFGLEIKGLWAKKGNYLKNISVFETWRNGFPAGCYLDNDKNIYIYIYLNIFGKKDH